MSNRKQIYYSSIEECLTERKRTTPPLFDIANTQYIFETNRITSSFKKQPPQETIPTSNRFREEKLPPIWDRFADTSPECIMNTFKYMFYKMKKGIFVQIRNNQMVNFIPFDNGHYRNEWGHLIKVDPNSVKQSFGVQGRYMSNVTTMIKRFRLHIDQLTGRPRTGASDLEQYKSKLKKYQTLPPYKWRANNCILRFDSKVKDTGHAIMYNLFEELCQERAVPDIDIFVNRRDFPIITNDQTEAYNHIFGTKKQPLLSHSYDKYCPILSMVTTSRNADIPIPTGDDWTREQSKQSKFFTDNCTQHRKFTTPWVEKKEIAVFRGATTGCGVTIETNQRLKLAYLGTQHKDLLDAGVTKFNARPRKLEGSKYLQTIDVKNIGLPIVNFMTPEEQSTHKYIVHVDGHVAAFRLGLEMSMGSCILKADSPYRMWFSHMIEPWVHYVPVKRDLSDLIERIEWCKKHDSRCKKIAENAKEFYDRYLVRDGILDYMQNLLVSIRSRMGVHVYPKESILKQRIEQEFAGMRANYPSGNYDLGYIRQAVAPKCQRKHSVLRAIEKVFLLVRDQGKFASFAPVVEEEKMPDRTYIRTFLGTNVFCKTDGGNKNRQLENKHEIFIAENCTNKLLEHIPNFSYVFGMTNDNEVVSEYMGGVTFQDWISTKFVMTDFSFIICQLCLSVQMAQEMHGFVHNDLTPWNIMIVEKKDPIKVSYIIGDQVYTVVTKLIPVIIDYGKSHIIHENTHHGHTRAFSPTSSQDIIILLNSCMKEFVRSHNNVTADKLIHLMNFMSNTQYRKDKFRTLQDIKFFLMDRGKYADLVFSDKYELTNLKPIDLYDHIVSNSKHITKYLISKSDIFDHSSIVHFPMAGGNARQVFDTLIGYGNESRKRALDRIYACDISTTDPVLKYFAAQSVYDSAESIATSSDRLSEIKTKMQRFLLETKELHTDKLKVPEMPSVIKYDEHLFLNPARLNDLRKSYPIPSKIDLVEYKNIISLVVANRGTFAFKPNDIRGLRKLIRMDSFRYMVAVANRMTLDTI